MHAIQVRETHREDFEKGVGKLYSDSVIQGIGSRETRKGAFYAVRLSTKPMTRGEVHAPGFAEEDSIKLKQW